MVGFFSKKQYAAIAARAFAMKLLKERCHECSICAIFFCLSLTVSIKARFLNRILSTILISELFILFFTLVITCMPLIKRLSNNTVRYILCRHTVSLFSKKRLCFKGFRLSTFPEVNIKLRISPLSLITKCKLNPKNHPIEHIPFSASSFKCLIDQYTLVATHKEVKSTKQIPVQVPKSTCLIKIVNKNNTPFLIQQTGYKTHVWETNESDTCRHIPDNSV